MTRPERGLTLVETLVACFVLSMMLVSVIWIQQTSAKAARQSDLSTDAYRAVMLAVEKLGSEFRGAQVIPPSPGDVTLKYWKPRLVGGVIQILPSGEPDWEPGAPAVPDQAEVRLQSDGWLVRDFQGTVQRLAMLGQGGSVTFDMAAGSRVIEVKVASRLVSPNDPSKVSTYQADWKTFLFNQP